MKSSVYALGMALLMLFCGPLFAADVTQGVQLSQARISSGHDTCIAGCSVLTSEGSLSNVSYNETPGLLVISASVDNLTVNVPGDVMYPNLKSVELILNIADWQRNLSRELTASTFASPMDTTGLAMLVTKSGTTITRKLGCALYIGDEAQTDFSSDRAIDCSITQRSSDQQDLPGFTFTFGK